MANFLINNNFTQSTADISQPIVVEDSFEARAVFSINASNQIEGTAWLVKNGQHIKTMLGSLSFLIRDKDGVSVGISATGLNADANGLYKLGPISSSVLQDLTHYTVDLVVGYQSLNIQNVVAITLGE